MSILIEVKINGVNTLVDPEKLEKLENGLFADNYLPNGKIDIKEQEKDDEVASLKVIINECNQYFDSTRWYNDRFVEQGILMPDEVVLARQECRVKMSDAKARLKELGVEV